MVEVIKTPLPKNAHIWTMVQDGDFLDGYAVRSDLSLKEAATIGFALPAWAEALMALRNKLVAPLGLKTETDVPQGDTDGTVFETTYESEAELNFGTDDSHLDFRISVRREGEMIHMGTWVHRNNWIGRIYLAVVMPFHILIVRSAMKRIARHEGPKAVLG